MRRSKIIALLALAGSLTACTRSAKEGEGAASAKKTSAASQAPEKKTTAIAIPSDWTAPIAKAYEKLHGLGPDDRGQAIKGILALAKRGAAAEGALRRLSDDPARAERVRAMAGVMVARLHRYDRAGLQMLILSKNAFAAREAVLLLSQLGGADAKQALEKAAAQRPAIGTYVRFKLKTLEKKPLPPRAESLLQRLLADPKSDKKKWAATALAVDYPQLSEKPLRALLKMVVADKETRMQAAFALVQANRKKLEKLESFARPGNGRFLRYAAFNELMQLGAPGRAVVKRFAERPGEKMRNHLRRLLAKP